MEKLIYNKAQVQAKVRKSYLGKILLEDICHLEITTIKK